MSYMNSLVRNMRMSNTEQVSGGLRLLCRVMQGLAVAGGLTLVLFSVLDDGIGAVIDHYWAELDDAQRAAVTYTDFKKGLVTMIAALSVFSPLLVLFGIWYVFGTFAKGPALSGAAVGSLRLLGILIIARVAASLATLPAMMLALTYDNPEGLRVLSLAFNTHHVRELLYGVLLIVIGVVLKKAVEIAEENGQFV